LLAELAHSSLVAEHQPGRFACRDLLRLYAAELARRVDGGADLRAASHRLLDHYLCTASAADRFVGARPDPGHPPSASPGVTTVRISSYSKALAWFQAEYPALIAAVKHAARQEFDTHACQLADTVGAFLDLQGHWGAWAETQHLALAAAERRGDSQEQASAHRSIGLAYTQLCRYGDARAHIERALEICRQLGDRIGEGHTHLDLARFFERQGQYCEAAGHVGTALNLARTNEDTPGQAIALNAMGRCHIRLGNYGQALDCCQQALELHRRLGSRYGQAAAWDSLGLARDQLGHRREAIDYYQRSLLLFRELGSRYAQAEVLTRLGEVHNKRGHPKRASMAWEEALAILNDLQHPQASQVRSRLARLGGPR